MERCTEISNVNFTGENSHPTLVVVTPLSLYIKDQGLIFFTNTCRAHEKNSILRRKTTMGNKVRRKPKQHTEWKNGTYREKRRMGENGVWNSEL